MLRGGGVPILPLVKEIDHILIRAASHVEPLMALLSNTLCLPVGSNGIAEAYLAMNFVSGWVCAGNVLLEVLHFGSAYPHRHAVAYPLPRGARLHGLAFSLHAGTMQESLAEVHARGIDHGPIEEYREADKEGRARVWFSNIQLYGFLTRGEFFLMRYPPDEEYATMGIDPPDQRVRHLQQQLLEREGGPLGITCCTEVQIGVTNLPDSSSRWQRLLDPSASAGPGYWKLGEGPAIRLVSSGEDELMALLLGVHSLSKARAFLHSQGLCGEVSASWIELDPTVTQSIRIRLCEE